MSKTAQINEIFSSIQGEGLYIGAKQLFIRFSGCNLHCDYCDTPHDENMTCYTTLSLVEKINTFDLKNIHSISLTGGEPLLHMGFLLDFLPLCTNQIYLETNGTLVEPFDNVAKFIDIAAVDIKLNSVSNQGSLFNTHDEFIKIAVKHNVKTFAKIVFDENILNSEIHDSCKLSQKYNIPLILQPKMKKNKICLNGNDLINILDKFLDLYKNVRLIPQTHKFICVE